MGPFHSLHIAKLMWTERPMSHYIISNLLMLISKYFSIASKSTWERLLDAIVIKGHLRWHYMHWLLGSANSANTVWISHYSKALIFQLRIDFIAARFYYSRLLINTWHEIIDKEKASLSIKCHLRSHRFTVILVFKKEGTSGDKH